MIPRDWADLTPNLRLADPIPGPGPNPSMFVALEKYGGVVERNFKFFIDQELNSWC